MTTSWMTITEATKRIQEHMRIIKILCRKLDEQFDRSIDVNHDDLYYIELTCTEFERFIRGYIK